MTGGISSDEAAARLARSAATFEALVRNNPFGIYVVDQGFRLLEISRGSEAVFAGIEPLIGRDFAEILRLIWTEPFASEAIGRFRHTLASGEPFISYSTVEPRANKDATEAYDWRIERIDLPDGSHGVVCYFYDLSERTALETRLREALADKDLLMLEVDHRVRNNLSMIGSLLAMQRNSVSHPETRVALEAAAARVVAIAQMHERLYKNASIGAVDFGDYLQGLCNDLAATVRRGDLSFDVRTQPIQVPADVAVPLGIVANELITNACKYSAVDSGNVGIELAAAGGEIRLEVSNEGSGMPADFDPVKSSGLGLRVIDSLTRRLGGRISFPQPGEPARFVIRVPLAVLPVAPGAE